MIRWLFPLVLLVLVGCAGHPIATLTAVDASNASAMARRQTGDPQALVRASCYDAWGNIATGIIAVQPGSAGVFTGVETGIEVQGTLQLPACQAIAGNVLLWLARKAPGGNLLP